MHDVAITGLGVVSAIGLDAETFHAAIMAGACGIKPAPWRAATEGRQAWWGTVAGFVPGDWMDDKIEDGTDLCAQFTLAATAQAVQQAGLAALDPLRTAIVHGSSIGGARRADQRPAGARKAHQPRDDESKDQRSTACRGTSLRAQFQRLRTPAPAGVRRSCGHGLPHDSETVPCPSSDAAESTAPARRSREPERCHPRGQW